MARKTTVKAFEAWIADDANVQAVLDLVIEGKTLREASLAVKQPYTCLQGYFKGSEAAQARYTDALQSYADAVHWEAKQIADSVPAEKDEINKAKLRIEVRLNQAKSLHRDRWGDRLQVDKTVVVGVDQALLGSVDELLRLAGEKVVEEVPLLEKSDAG